MTPVPSHAEALEWDEGNERELAGAWHRAGGGARGVGQPADLGAERPPQVRRLEDVRHDRQRETTHDRSPLPGGSRSYPTDHRLGHYARRAIEVLQRSLS